MGLSFTIWKKINKLQFSLIKKIRIFNHYKKEINYNDDI